MKIQRSQKTNKSQLKRLQERLPQRALGHTPAWESKTVQLSPSVLESTQAAAVRHSNS